jgi:hypothetical protein
MTEDHSTTQTNAQSPQGQSALQNLGRFIGKWNVTLVFPMDPPGTVHAQTGFDWIEDEAFMIQRLGDSQWIIGPDGSSETYYALYHDGRGVSRVYQMSLHKNVWKIWRDSPGFSQRFEGTFSNDGKTITAQWEISSDGSTWEHDFSMTYTKLS